MTLKPATLATPINDRPLPEPKWAAHTRRVIDHHTAGRVTAFLNARGGLNARALGQVHTMVEAAPGLCAQAKAEPWRGQAHWARLDELPAHERRRIVGRHVFDPSRFACAPATATTLRAGAYRTVVVDHAQLEKDPAALMAEARRLTDGTGWLVLVGYGRPRFADPHLDDILSGFWSTLRVLQRGLERHAGAGLHDLELGIAPLPSAPIGRDVAEAQVGVAELLRWVDSLPSTRALELKEGPYPFNCFAHDLRAYWRDTRRRTAAFETGVRIGAFI